MAETAPARTITLLNIGEGDHNFEVPRRHPDGKPQRGPSRVEDRGDGRTRTIPGAPQLDYYRLPPRHEGGMPSKLSLTQAEFDRLAKDEKMGPLLRDLITGERPEVMLNGAQLPAAA